MNLLTPLIPELVALRRDLHRYPEASGHELKTAGILLDFIQHFQPDDYFPHLGKTGMAIVYKGSCRGPTLLFRAEMDALPIEEDIDIPYISTRKKISHKCGHDGHMAILCGLAALLSRNRQHYGRIVLLFQPAEETGLGAQEILNDPKFKRIEPDYILALHNVPGYNEHTIIVRDGTFSMASEGMTIQLKGVASHAAYPEQGICPLNMMLDVLNRFPKLPSRKVDFKDFIQTTVTYMKLGRQGFGISPGYGEIGLTLRAADPSDLIKLRETLMRICQNAAQQYYIEEIIHSLECFPAVVNDPDVNRMICMAAMQNHLPVLYREEPFRWSEDFGHYLKKYKGALFGLGAGENHSDLHNWYYDFPDQLIESGVKMLYSIVKEAYDT